VREAAPLDRVVTRALSKQPAARFQSAEEFRDALKAALPAAITSLPAARAIDATAVLTTATTPASYLPVEPVASVPAPYRRSRSDSRLGILAAVVIALLVMVPVIQTILPGAASAASSVARSSSSASPAATAVVPLLTGTLQDAQAALIAQGLVVGKVTSRNSSQVEGRLLEQAPAPGSLSTRGAAVDLVTATGRNAVPQLAGITVAAATAQLKAAGFLVAGSTGSTTVVGSSSPPGGQVVRVGTRVTLVASTPTPTPTPSPSQPTDSASVTTPPPTTSATPTLPSSLTSTTASASGGA
jgi:serine/threonine-protein kinase